MHGGLPAATGLRDARPLPAGDGRAGRGRTGHRADCRRDARAGEAGHARRGGIPQAGRGQRLGHHLLRHQVRAGR